MIGIAMYTTIITLWEQKKSKSEISRITKHDRKTVSKIIKNYINEGKQRPDKKRTDSPLVNFKEDILKLLEKDLSVVRIHEELAKLGSRASYQSLARYTRDLRDKTDICIRFDTEAGEEAQVDFGYSGMQPSPEGELKKSWFFNMRLSYSRLDYYEVVFDQRVETFIQCHINAFKYFGGVPKIVKIDNLKAAILEAHFYEVVHQQYYKKFADHYEFFSLPCRVRKPQEKGKTESAIKYGKGNFFAGRSFETFEQLLSELNNWLEYKCNARIHGTTKKVPRELFEQEEREFLIKLPIEDFNISSVGVRKVQRDCHIVVENNYYSVPYKYVGEDVEIELDNKLLRVFYDNQIIVTHVRCVNKGQFITNRAHYPDYKLCTPSSPEYQDTYRKKLQDIGSDAASMLEMLLINRPHDWNRVAKGLISLGKTYDKNIVNLACARALEFEIFNYSKIKSICASGAYNLPIAAWRDKNDSITITA
jgi:transposase